MKPRCSEQRGSGSELEATEETGATEKQEQTNVSGQRSRVLFCCAERGYCTENKNCKGHISLRKYRSLRRRQSALSGNIYHPTFHNSSVEQTTPSPPHRAMELFVVGTKGSMALRGEPFSFLRQFSLCSLGSSGSHCVDQAGFVLTEICLPLPQW